MNRKDFIKNIATITGGGLLIPRFLHPLLGQNMQSNLRESFNNKIVRDLWFTWISGLLDYY